MKKYALIHTWFDESRYAEAFYQKAKSNFDKFPFSGEVAICLCSSPYTSRFCLVYAEMEDSDDYDTVDDFLSESGCPQKLSFEDGDPFGNLCLDTLDSTAINKGYQILERTIRNAWEKEESASFSKEKIFISFDTDKCEEYCDTSSYGYEAWKIFYKHIHEAKELKSTILYTHDGTEYTIAISSDSDALYDLLESRFKEDDLYQKVKGSRGFYGSDTIPYSFNQTAEITDRLKFLLSNNTYADIYVSMFGNKADQELWNASYSGDLDKASKAIENGADVDYISTEDGVTTPLFIAACEGQTEVAKLLLDKGANPNTNNTTLTALMIASRRGNMDIVKALFEAGADIEEDDGAGSIAQDYANEYPEIKQFLMDERQKIVEKRKEEEKKERERIEAIRKEEERKLKEEQDRIESIKKYRKNNKLCILSGEKLSFFERLFGKEHRKGYTTFQE